jgi:DNA-binding GntR family transcriptional regulator
MQQFPVTLQRSFEARIINNDWAPETILDYSSLVEIFDCSVLELDKVLQSAIRKGLIKQISKNAFLVQPITKPDIQSVFQFASNSGLKPESIVRELDVQNAYGEIAEKLKIPEGFPVFKQVRTRMVDQIVIANQYNFIPYDVCPALESIDLTHYSFQEALQHDFNTIISSINETYAIYHATSSDTQILGLPEHEDVLRVERISLTRNGNPVVWADIHVKITEYAKIEKLWPGAKHIIGEYLK